MGKLGTVEHTVEIDRRVLRFEGGKLAQLAGGAVVVSLDDTTVLTTTTASSQPKESLGFFPLTIEVEERMYAAGKIPGGFFKREGRPSEGAILTCRLTDRPLRPTFVDGLRNEIQVVNTILQTTQTDPYDVVAMNASSLATMLAGVPFHGPVAATRYAMLRDGSWTAFPTFQILETEAIFNMVVAGRVTDGGDVAILMVEAEATPNAWRMVEAGAAAPTEEIIGQALENVKPILKQICDAQTAFVEELGAREGIEFPLFPDYTEPVFDLVSGFAHDRVEEVFTSASLTKEQRGEAIAEIRVEAVDHAVQNGPDDLDEATRRSQGKEAFRAVEKKVVRRLIADKGLRIDGRGLTDIRPLTAEVDMLPRAHGTGYFQRGETQVLSVLALGSLRAAQRLDTLDPVEEKRFIHHYNFPPSSTGETGRVGSPKRREIGHGALAERALKPVVPDEEAWPYTIRLVSDVMTSNGSTSMASVCGSTLALMDGGVPIHAPVAGIAMGLIHEGGAYQTLTDIQGTEDFFGDMDFKVAGTREFVTALQLDTKLDGIPAEILADALLQAREARLAILKVMSGAIEEPRAEVADTAPRVTTVKIPQDRIGDVIGPKGKIIREMTEETGTDIDVDEAGGYGLVRIYGMDKASVQAAVDRVNAIANPVVPAVGERFHGTVVKTVDFGAFVSLTPGIDGLLHISKLSQVKGQRLNHAEEAVQVGEQVWVEVLEIVDGRKFKLGYVADGEDTSSSTDSGSASSDADADRPARQERGGGREGRDRGSRDRGSRDRGGDSPSDNNGQDSADDAATADEGERTRTRSRTRE